MPSFMTFLLRVFLLLAGLLFAASLAVVATLVVALWVVRAAWAKLTGRPSAPFIVRVNPRRGFERLYPRPPQRSASPADITDVEPKTPI